MSENGGDIEAGERIPPRRKVPHYHGGEVRSIFVMSAVLLVFAKSTGADLPLSTFATVVSAAILVVAAGVTNPTHFWIHWANAFIAVYGTILFGTTAVDNYRAGTRILDPSFIYVEALALLSLIALYFTTRTVRGIHMRPGYTKL